MRRFTFRFWDKKRNVMDYQDLEDLCEADYWFDGESSVWGALHDSHNKQENFIAMQCAGLKDKNGKDIYEGDLCTDEKDSLIEIVWNDHHQWGCKIINGGTLVRDLTFPLWHWDKCEQNGYRQLEIIGNIYENPELLGTQ